MSAQSNVHEVGFLNNQMVARYHHQFKRCDSDIQAKLQTLAGQALIIVLKCTTDLVKKMAWGGKCELLDEDIQAIMEQKTLDKKNQEDFVYHLRSRRSSEMS